MRERERERDVYNISIFLLVKDVSGVQALQKEKLEIYTFHIKTIDIYT